MLLSFLGVHLNGWGHPSNPIVANLGDRLTRRHQTDSLVASGGRFPSDFALQNMRI